jgi:hypothetical protein
MLRRDTSEFRAEPSMMLLGICFVGATWLFMLMAIGLISELVLAPWDIVSDAYRPPLGTWERALNDSFENGLLGQLLFLILYGSQIGFITFGLIRFHKSTLLTYFALINGAFILLCLLLLLSPFAPGSPQNMADIAQIGYHRTMPGVIAFFIAVLAFLAVQFRLATKGTQALVAR